MLDPSGSDAVERTRRADRRVGAAGTVPLSGHASRAARPTAACSRSSRSPRRTRERRCSSIAASCRSASGASSVCPADSICGLAIRSASRDWRSPTPHLPFIIPHFGAGMFREALMAADTCPNIHLDTSSSNSWIRYTPGLTLDAVFKTALDGRRRSTSALRHRLVLLSARLAARDLRRRRTTRSPRLVCRPTDQALILGGNFERIFAP